jgi:hypothetical protein
MLSKRAKALLARSERNFDYGPLTPKSFVEFLQQENCPTDHPALDFQMKYGGYKLFLRKGYNQEAQLRGFQFSNSSELQLGVEWDDSMWLTDNDWRFLIGYYKNGQDGYSVTSNGFIYYVHTPIASSADTFLESLALRDAIWDNGSYWCTRQVKIKHAAQAQFRNLSDYLPVEVVPEASDTLQSWWQNQDWLIHISPNWDNSDELDITVYVRDEKMLRHLDAKLNSMLEEELSKEYGIWFM